MLCIYMPAIDRPLSDSRYSALRARGVRGVSWWTTDGVRYPGGGYAAADSDGRDVGCAFSLSVRGRGLSIAGTYIQSRILRGVAH